MKRARAFSMIEILVSATLLAIVGALLLTSLQSSLDAKDQVEAVSGRYHLIRSAMSRMCDEISMAYVAGQGHVALNEPRTKTGFLGERDSIKFTGFGYVPRVEDEKKSDERQLAFYLDTDPKTQTQSLIRREQPNIDDNFEEGGRALTLLTNVRELSFEYWDPTKEDWKEKWDFTAPENNNTLPPRVRISLTAVMEDGHEEKFVTQTKLWLLTPLTF